MLVLVPVPRELFTTVVQYTCFTTVVQYACIGPFFSSIYNLFALLGRKATFTHSLNILVLVPVPRDLFATVIQCTFIGPCSEGPFTTVVPYVCIALPVCFHRGSFLPQGLSRPV